jgi:transposase InsO family protein
MPWHEVRKVESRRLFVHGCTSGCWSVSEGCRRFGISRRTGYKWLSRYKAEGSAGLQDRSRRPHAVTYATAPPAEAALVALRQEHPYWGVRKLCTLLQRRGIVPPPERTANRILKRHGLVVPRGSSSGPLQRFERSRPNALWQIDHKRAVHGSWARRSVPLVVVDDASRYLLGLRALPDKGVVATWEALWEVFGEFGLPESMLSDNDSVFHGRCGPSQLEARLMRLDIEVLHGRPYHPQTQGKVERLNGTLELEVLRDGRFSSPEQLQSGYDAFRQRYNFERPHDALALAVPASRYEPSRRRRPRQLPQIEYPSGTLLRRVQKNGWMSWRGYIVPVGEGLYGERVEVREVAEGIEIYYGRHRIMGWQPDAHSKRRHRQKG